MAELVGDDRRDRVVHVQPAAAGRRRADLGERVGAGGVGGHVEQQVPAGAGGEADGGRGLVPQRGRVGAAGLGGQPAVRGGDAERDRPVALLGPEAGHRPVHGVEVGPYRILRAQSPAAPNAIAAVLLTLRDATGVRPQCHFEWAEGSPLVHMFRYLLLGRGDTAPVIPEIIRKSEPDPARRPGIHVG